MGDRNYANRGRYKHGMMSLRCRPASMAILASLMLLFFSFFFGLQGTIAQPGSKGEFVKTEMLYYSMLSAKEMGKGTKKGVAFFFFHLTPFNLNPRPPTSAKKNQIISIPSSRAVGPGPSTTPRYSW